MNLSIVSEYMSSHPHVLEPANSVAAAHRLMQRHKIHHLPVVSDGRLVGIVSQRDLLIACNFLTGAEEDIQVSMVMEKDVLTLSSSAGVVEVARKMLEAHVGSAVVMSGEKITGIFTTVDALGVLAASEHR